MSTRASRLAEYSIVKCGMADCSSALSAERRPGAIVGTDHVARL
jgi:hypothetical protein